MKYIHHIPLISIIKEITFELTRRNLICWATTDTTSMDGSPGYVSEEPGCRRSERRVG